MGIKRGTVRRGEEGEVGTNIGEMRDNGGTNGGNERQMGGMRDKEGKR